MIPLLIPIEQAESNRAQLVEEDDARWASCAGWMTDVRFRLSVQQLRAFDRKKVQRTQGHDHLGERGLVYAQGSIKKDLCVLER